MPQEVRRWRTVNLDQTTRKVEKIVIANTDRVIYSLKQSLCMFDPVAKQTIWEWEMIEDIKIFYLMYKEDSRDLFAIITLIEKTG